MATSNEQRNGRSASSSPPAKPSSTYRYERLKGKNSIRVLELLPDKKGAPLKCKMLEVTLDDAPSYEAVSYVWGPPEFVKQIYIGTRKINITRSCSYALHHLRLKDSPRILWIDACCIDQKSRRERSQQVGMMGDIYSRAKCTLVWLGRTAEGNIDTMSYISRIGRALSQGQGRSTDGTTGLIYAKTDAKKPWYRNLVDADKPTIKDFNQLFGKPWFQRVWTVQEFALSRHCIIMCGKGSMKAEYLMAFLAHNEEQTFLLSRLHRVHLHRQMQTYVRLTRDSRRKTSDVVGCSQLLLGARRQSSTDPKDKIFAFQGILSLLNIPLPAPDYSKPVEQIYREAAAASIHHDVSLMLLSSLTGESKLKGLPSWVPDWSNEDIVSELALWSEYLAAGTSRPAFSFSGGDRLLTLRGMIIGTIANVSNSYPDANLLHSEENADYTARKQEVAVLQQCFNKFGDKTTEFFTDFARNAWTRTREADFLGPHGVPHYWVAAIKELGPHSIADNIMVKSKTESYKKERRKLGDDPTELKMKAQLLTFHNIIRTLLDRKTMFTTWSGTLGIGYRSIKSGDRIALFAGCNLPMIIRHGGANWRIVCPAYVENAMYSANLWTSEEKSYFTFE